MTRLISIIIPVYNTEGHLLDCLNSVKNQTYKNFETILIDDGSKDQSGVICDSFSEKDSRFKVIHQQNQGVSKARLNGFISSKGDYVTFIDSDDVVDPLYLEKLFDPLIENDADITCCQVTRVYGNIRDKEKHSILGTFEKNDILFFLKNYYLHDIRINRTGMPLYLVGKIYKRSFLVDGLTAGLGLKLGEDQIGLFCMLQAISRITIISDYLYDYIFHEGQATANYRPDFWDNKLEVFRRYQEIDKDNLLKDQLPLRMWRVLINGIEQKMRPYLSSYEIFKDMVIPVLQDKTFKSLFCRRKLPYGLKKNIKFWTLKYKLYYLYYFIYIKRIYLRKDK